MTIAAGFICSDGILLASDTLYSGQVNRFGRKFWVIDRGNCCVVFGGAGTERGLLRTRDEIRACLRPGMSHREVVKSIDDALLDVNTRLNPTQEDRTYALVGIRADGEDRQWLYHNDGGGSMISVINDYSQCVGYGSSLGFYFARSLFTPSMPVRWAKVVAAQLIKQCKLHSGYCGGDTHLVEWPSDGIPSVIQDQVVIRSLEGHLDVMEAVTRAILLDDKASDDTLFERAKIINENVRALEKRFFVNVGPASLTLSAPSVQAHVIVGTRPEEKSDPE